MCITANEPDTNSTTKLHAVVSIQLNTCPTYPEKFIRDNVVLPFFFSTFRRHRTTSAIYLCRKYLQSTRRSLNRCAVIWATMNWAKNRVWVILSHWRPWKVPKKNGVFRQPFCPLISDYVALGQTPAEAAGPSTQNGVPVYSTILCWSKLYCLLIEANASARRLA